MSEDSLQELIETAKAARLRSVAPFSNFLVGAAVKTADGKVYTGCNIESASYGLTVCGERVAIWKALSEGEQALHGAGDCRRHRNTNAALWHLPSNHLGVLPRDATIILANLQGESQVVSIRELLPRAFDARFLSGAKKESVGFNPIVDRCKLHWSR